ncbi:uncharacterized protein LOC134831903 [Culicoides brevitarsis]|uniref:uncharacterized protein LOC134831903 n=1 Tax=Culicoides brevitarsis TaxID=469753 RepID=UPI00307B28A2
MSEKVLKCVAKPTNLRVVKSDLNLLNNSSCGNENDLLLKSGIKNIISPINNLRGKLSHGKAFEMLNNSLIDVDLGVSVMKNDSQLDVSQLADCIVSNAIHIPRCLYCPFCAVEYMFEFSLKDHLKKVHMNEIMEIASKKKSVTDIYDIHTCPYCTAVFYHFVLIPVHLAQHHSPGVLQKWQESEGNMTEWKSRKNECPSVELIACSPGMSDLLKSLDISGKEGKKEQQTQPQLKSILKRKTNMSGRIIFSPSSASLRRIGDDHSKRNMSARRELRFDLPANVEHNYTLEPSDPLYRLRESPTPKKRQWKKLFSSSSSTPMNKNQKSHRIQKKNSKNSSSMITSTPISFLDATDFVPLQSLKLKETKKKNRFWQRIFRKKVVVDHPSKDTSFLPSFYASEKYKCAVCKSKFEDNAELRCHLREKHWRVLAPFRAQYECGQCLKTFYRNNRLIYHCHYHHTPQKHRSSL